MYTPAQRGASEATLKLKRHGAEATWSPGARVTGTPGPFCSGVMYTYHAYKEKVCSTLKQEPALVMLHVLVKRQDESLLLSGVVRRGPHVATFPFSAPPWPRRHWHPRLRFWHIGHDTAREPDITTWFRLERGDGEVSLVPI